MDDRSTRRSYFLRQMQEQRASPSSNAPRVHVNRRGSIDISFNKANAASAASQRQPPPPPPPPRRATLTRALPAASDDAPPAILLQTSAPVASSPQETIARQQRKLDKQSRLLASLQAHLESLPTPAALLEERQKLLSEQRARLQDEFARKARVAAAAATEDEMARMWQQIEVQSQALEDAEKRAGNIIEMSKSVGEEHAEELRALAATHANMLKDAETRASDAATSVSEKHAEELRALAAAHARALHDAEARAEDFSVGLQQVGDEFTDAEAAAAEENTSLRSELKAMRENATRVQDEHVEELRALAAAHARALHDAEARVDDFTVGLKQVGDEHTEQLRALHASAVAAEAAASSLGAAEEENGSLRRELKELREMSIGLAQTLADERRTFQSTLEREQVNAAAATKSAVAETQASTEAQLVTRINEERQQREAEVYERRLREVLASSLANQRAQIEANNNRERAAERERLRERFEGMEAGRDAAVREALTRQRAEMMERFKVVLQEQVNEARRRQQQPKVSEETQPQDQDARFAALETVVGTLQNRLLERDAQLEAATSRLRAGGQQQQQRQPQTQPLTPSPAMQVQQPKPPQSQSSGDKGDQLAWSLETPGTAIEAMMRPAAGGQRFISAQRPHVHVRRTGSIVINKPPQGVYSFPQ